MARNRKIRHYSHSYRTRKKRQQKVWKFLLFLLVLAALVFVGYSIADSLGRLALNGGESSSLYEPEPSVISPPGGESGGESSEEASVPESQPETPAGDVRAVTMPLETLLSPTQRATFLEAVDSALYNTVAVPLKDRQGQVYYQTGLDLASLCGALSQQALDPEALAKEISDAGFIPAALIYSLQDDYASHASYGTSYMYQNQSSVTWLDNSADQGGKSWLNPYLPKAVDYLSGIAGELSAVGFQDIFVFGNQYPTTSNQRGMGFGEQGGVSQADALQNVLSAMQEAAGNCRIIPAYLGECYNAETKPHIYTASPNTFAISPSAPIVGADLTVLDAVTAAPDALVPVITGTDLIAGLQERGIQEYLVN